MKMCLDCFDIMWAAGVMVGVSMGVISAPTGISLSGDYYQNGGLSERGMRILTTFLFGLLGLYAIPQVLNFSLQKTTLINFLVGLSIIMTVATGAIWWGMLNWRETEG